jgi:hypothetical protein
MGKYLSVLRWSLFGIFGVVAGGTELSFAEFFVLLLLAATINAISYFEGRNSA